MPMRDLAKLPLLPDFNRDLPTTIYFHGWLENGTMDLSTVAIRGAYLDVIILSIKLCLEIKI
jgi:hypothetical protein